MKRDKGILITFEGVDGSGKTTQAKRVQAWLQERLGMEIPLFREPGGTRLGEELRTLLLGVEGEHPVTMAEVFLFLASRAQLAYREIRPRLDLGEIVLCDRFTDSTLAYQGQGRDLNRAQLHELNQLATGALIPDLTFVIDIDPQQASQRRSKRFEDEDRLESEHQSFMQKVREGYQILYKEDQTGRMHWIEGGREPDEIFAEIQDIIQKKLGQE